MNRSFAIYIIVLSSILNCQAQDIHFSQYPYSPLNLSPGATGLFDGDIRANAFYRQQWKSVTVPYKTFGVSYEQIVGSTSAKGKRNAAGIAINNDRAGDGDLGTRQAIFSFSVLYVLGQDSIHFLNAGLQAGFAYRSLNMNKLTFDNQFTGDIYDPSAPSNEIFDRTSYIYPDFSIGLTWQGNYPNSTLFAGMSVQHLLTPEQTFLGENSELPPRTQLHAGAWLKKNHKISIFPSVNHMDQDEFMATTFGAEVKIKASNNMRSKAFSAGLHYRVNDLKYWFHDAVIPSLAVYYDLWRFGISYDINISSLKTASNSRGGPEFNLTYIMKKVKYVPRKNNCPVY